MFSVNSDITVGQVGVATSDNGGLSNEQISKLATNKIVSISEICTGTYKTTSPYFCR